MEKPFQKLSRLRTKKSLAQGNTVVNPLFIHIELPLYCSKPMNCTITKQVFQELSNLCYLNNRLKTKKQPEIRSTKKLTELIATLSFSLVTGSYLVAMTTHKPHPPSLHMYFVPIDRRLSLRNSLSEVAGSKSFPTAICYI